MDEENIKNINYRVSDFIKETKMEKQINYNILKLYIL